MQTVGDSRAVDTRDRGGILLARRPGAPYGSRGEGEAGMGGEVGEEVGGREGKMIEGGWL